MIETWAIIAIAAAFFQNLRSALQKHLKGSLSDTAAAYTRFLYALPFTLLYLYALQATGHDLPSLNLKFLGYCLLGGIAQILFTVILLRMFSYKSFAVGTTFSKLEVVFVAALGALLLKDLQTAWTLVGISLCVSGVVMLSIGKTGTRLYKDVFTRTTAMGLVCAFFLGASVVFFRAAALALNHHSVITSAAAALVAALIIQTLLMGMWLAYTAIEQWKKILQQWKWAKRQSCASRWHNRAPLHLCFFHSTLPGKGLYQRNCRHRACRCRNFICRFK